MDATTATILANEARRTELKTSLAAIRAEIDTTSNLNAMLSQANSDAMRRLQQKAAELAALEAGAGPGVTDDFGHRQEIVAAFIAKAKESGLITVETLEQFNALAGL